MPADRTRKAHPHKNAAAGPSEKHRVVPPLEARDGLMGVSKIKSQIRQTKRLLAKENIEPGLRVATQRRLTSLQADLASAEKRGVEKKNGAKYHAVKFFERQKLQRIIKRVKREIGELEGEGESEIKEKEGKADKKGKGDKKGKKEKKVAKLNKELKDARTMLNYVIHFPNTQKYIALFADRDSKGELALPPHLDEEVSEGPAGKRREILLEMARLMEEGKIGGTPESEPHAERLSLDIEDKKVAKVDKVEEEVVEEDDFFGDD